MKYDSQMAAFSQLLISGTFVHEGRFDEVQQAYSITIHPQLVVVVSIDRYPELCFGQKDEWRCQVGHDLVDAVAAVITYPYTWIWTEEGVLALLVDGHSCAAGEDIQVLMTQVGRDLQAEVAKSGFTVSIGIGGVYEEPEHLHQSWSEAVQAMSGRFFQGNQLIFIYDEDLRIDDVRGDVLSTEKAELLALVRIGDEAHALHKLGSLLEALARECQYNEAMFRSEVTNLVMMITRMVVESGVSASTVLKENARFIRELYATIRYDKFVQKVSGYTAWLISQAGHAQMHKLSPVIRKAIHFIAQNHKQNLSLDEVARFCAMSKYHLSHLFKNETGCGVIEFLNRMRMEKAVVYLQTTDWPIQQIASHVGFEDANYFSRMFKKYMQKSPRDFRSATLC